MYRRVVGLVAASEKENQSASTVTPAPRQVVTKVFWWAPSNARWESWYCRIADFSGAYSPNVDGRPATHVHLGAPIVGSVDHPNSDRFSTNVIAWDHASYEERAAYGPFTLMRPP